jgi:hypothetical protein
LHFAVCQQIREAKEELIGDRRHAAQPLSDSARVFPQLLSQRVGAAD